MSLSLTFAKRLAATLLTAALLIIPQPAQAAGATITIDDYVAAFHAQDAALSALPEQHRNTNSVILFTEEKPDSFDSRLNVIAFVSCESDKNIFLSAENWDRDDDLGNAETMLHEILHTIDQHLYCGSSEIESKAYRAAYEELTQWATRTLLYRAGIGYPQYQTSGYDTEVWDAVLGESDSEQAESSLKLYFDLSKRDVLHERYEAMLPVIVKKHYDAIVARACGRGFPCEEGGELLMDRMTPQQSLDFQQMIFEDDFLWSHSNF